MTQRSADLRARENQSKFVQQRINAVEKHFAELCQDFSAYSRKLARVRDRGDLLSKSLLTYAEAEAPSTKAGLTNFAEHISSIQDYRQAQVSRLEFKVVQPLTLYGTACKHAKDDLKSSFAAREKEINQQKKLDKVRQKAPSDRQQISQAESKLQKATVDATRSNKALEDQMDAFERKRLQDIKSILSEFVKIEMLFHAKCLESYTDAFQALQSISDEDDLEEFRNSLRPFSAADSNSRQSLFRGDSKQSLNSTTGSSRPSTVDRRRPAKQQLQYSEEDDEEEDDEEDDDDDEDYSEEDVAEEYYKR
ncbi:protein FAM92A isoform X2 [Strongylocentrotus purpuratus]|uniref:Protein FAM92A n=1 Tax=Strongylocentrotus purpuratus TaxID=7668 RepID=A0A7M7N5P7_STRPU|nr:protein FAM92A isoform X2 [Strongylocentrotus purpuratus]|eukprot:XP_011667669.1 PREDICTED: protein FAM92A1 [Strongylocentrotus purpuratus]